MGWQIPICQKESSSLKKVCLTAFAESEFGNPYIFRQPIYFSATHIFFGNPYIFRQPIYFWQPIA